MWSPGLCTCLQVGLLEGLDTQAADPREIQPQEGLRHFQR